MNLTQGAIAAGIELAERGYLTDFVVRGAIRRLCETRLTATHSNESDAFTTSLRSGPIALQVDAANSQHYELLPEFFQLVLGPLRKYSCCLWSNGSSTLKEAEEAALAETAEHAALEDGQNVLELGCGWGSLSLWMAERYPTSSFVAVSNSRAQRATIELLADERCLSNLTVITADMNGFSPQAAGLAIEEFDRIVSVEMFEHMRNYRELLRRLDSWLRPDGKLFVHIFCHRDIAYPFSSEGAANWMGRHFFTGGMMPSAGLLHQFDEELQVTREWRWNGQHYARTALAWLENLDRRRNQVLPILQGTYGREHAERWLQRWRMFFLAVAELFTFRDGNEWFVGHYLLSHVSAKTRMAAVLP